MLRLVLAVIPSLALFCIAEWAARLYRGDLKPQHPMYVPNFHEEYFGTRRVLIKYQTFQPYYWLPAPGQPLINSHGFRGREFSDQKKPGTLRIVCLGCSCTLGGQEPYPARLERLLAEALDSPKYEVINAGSGSSSTCQGLQILEQRVLALQPDIVTVFFGWNDRWVQDGRRDSQHRLPTPRKIRIVEALTKSRFMELMMYWSDKWRGRRLEQRVPVEEYEANLHQLVRLCRERGIRVLLCTAPDGMTRRGIERRFVRNQDAVNRFPELYELFADKGQTPKEVWQYIDRLYNGTVARVAHTDSTDLVDLQSELDDRRKLYSAPALWLFKDGIHFTELGMQEVARILALHILQGEERITLEKYLKSSAYYRRNMEQFMAQWQFAAADFMLGHAEALNGQPFADSDRLRAQIAAERTFYDPYYTAQFELSNGGDESEALRQLIACLQRRPNDIKLRLDLARYALLAHVPVVTLELIHAPGVEYTSPDDSYTAMWLVVHATRALGKMDVVKEQLQQILKEFPQDRQAEAMLAEIGGR